MKFCTKCVTPETAESLKFDNLGACSVCSQIKYKQKVVNWSERGIELDSIISKYKNKYKNYYTQRIISIHIQMLYLIYTTIIDLTYTGI